MRKVQCIEDRVYINELRRYHPTERVRSITKGRWYILMSIIDLPDYGGVHYLIMCDTGYKNYYFHTRFRFPELKKIKLI